MPVRSGVKAGGWKGNQKAKAAVYEAYKSGGFDASMAEVDRQAPQVGGKKIAIGDQKTRDQNNKNTMTAAAGRQLTDAQKRMVGIGTSDASTDAKKASLAAKNARRQAAIQMHHELGH